MKGQPENFPNIPGYHLLEKLGEGGMGTVYRAAQLSSQQTVAIKVLKPLPGGQEAVRALQRESGLMAALAHPGVVTVHACGEVGGRPYLILEYVAGPNLRTLLRPGRPWPTEPAWVLLDRIARALSYIHAQGILHLDLKPENVLMSGEWRVASGEQEEASSLATRHSPLATPKITDFGLALPRVDAGALSELGLAQGTVDYCSPEQRYGLPTDVRADLFALATLAYEMLTGQLPGRVFVPAGERNPQLPAAVDEVLRRGLARGPEERYRSVEEFRAALNAALNPGGEPGASAPGGTASPSRQQPLRGLTPPARRS